MVKVYKSLDDDKCLPIFVQLERESDAKKGLLKLGQKVLLLMDALYKNLRPIPFKIIQLSIM